jgi:hypothetical protein
MNRAQNTVAGTAITMKRACPRSFYILLFLFAAQTVFAATELEFSTKATRLTAADVTVADKARLIRLNDGTLVVVWIQAAGPPDGAWGLDGSLYTPNDVFIRISPDDGTTWSDPLNISNTAMLTDANALYDRVGDGSGLANFYGDSGKANVVAAGNNILVAWNDAYCGDGTPARARYAGPHGYVERPYRCLYAARLTVASGNVAAVATDRVTDGKRDVANEVARATGAGFALAWQEDPEGLQLGEARGHGDGESGARVTVGTDIWYAWLPQSMFADAAASWRGPTAITNNFDYTRGEATGGGASRPMLGLAGSPPRVVLVYEEMKYLGQADRGKFVRFHEFPFNAPPSSQQGVIISDPAENGRRARVMAMMSPGSASGARLLVIWRQGQGIQGAPADFMARIGSVPAGTKLADVPHAGFRIEDLWPEVNTDDAAANEPALNLSGASLDDPSWVDPLANAMAHRAVMNGDFIYAGYTFDPNGEDEVNEYQFLLRRSDDGGRTWSRPMSATESVSGSANVIEPRLVRSPGTIQSGSPRDVHNRDVYLIAWGTESILPDGLGTYRDELFVTRTSDRGLSFERAQALHDTRTAPDQTDEQIQLRTTPDGQNVSAVWIRKDSVGSSVMFASAVGITPTADLSLVARAFNQRPDVGDAFDVAIGVHNAGPQEATELQLSANIGAELGVSGVETASGSCEAGASISCELDDLGPGSSAVVNISLVAETRGDWEIEADTSAWEEEPEPADNRILLAGHNIPNANLSVKLDPNVTSIARGEEFGIGYGVTNHGPQVATDVTISVTLSGSGEFVDGPSCTVNLRTLTCSVPELAVGESWSETASVRAISGTSVAVYVSAVSTEQDSVTSDNSVGVDVIIDQPEPGIGGGCVFDPDGSGDSTLPALLLLGMIARWWRQRMAEATSTEAT